MLTIPINLKLSHIKHAYLVRKKQNNDLIFTGYDTLPDIITLRKIASHPMFDSSIEYNAIIIGAFEHYGMAYNAIREELKKTNEQPPILNYHVGKNYNRDKIILCNETMQIFKSQKDICSYFDIRQSNLSKHLTQYPGFKRLKGYSFRYLNAEELEKMRPYLKNV